MFQTSFPHSNRFNKWTGYVVGIRRETSAPPLLSSISVVGTQRQDHGLIKKCKLQDRQIHLNLNYGTNKPLLVNETMGQKQTPPPRPRALAGRSRTDRFAVSEFNGISLRRCAPRVLSHRCMENALGKR